MVSQNKAKISTKLQKYCKYLNYNFKQEITDCYVFTYAVYIE